MNNDIDRNSMKSTKIGIYPNPYTSKDELERVRGAGTERESKIFFNRENKGSDIDSIRLY